MTNSQPRLSVAQENRAAHGRLQWLIESVEGGGDGRLMLVGTESNIQGWPPICQSVQGGDRIR